MSRIHPKQPIARETSLERTFEKVIILSDNTNNSKNHQNETSHNQSSLESDHGGQVSSSSGVFDCSDKDNIDLRTSNNSGDSLKNYRNEEFMEIVDHNNPNSSMEESCSQENILNDKIEGIEPIFIKNVNENSEESGTTQVTVSAKIESENCDKDDTLLKSRPTNLSLSTTTATPPKNAGNFSPRRAFNVLSKYLGRKFRSSNSNLLSNTATTPNDQLLPSSQISKPNDERQNSISSIASTSIFDNSGEYSSSWSKNKFVFNKSKHYFNSNVPIYISACLYGTVQINEIPRKSNRDFFPKPPNHQIQKIENTNNHYKNYEVTEKANLPMNYDPNTQPEKYLDRFLPENSTANIDFLANNIKLPKNIERREWIATNVIGLFKQIFSLYEVVSKYCNNKNVKCRGKMVGLGGQVFYQDYNHTLSDLGNSTGSSKSKINKNLTTVNAPRFICWAYEESHLIFEDERYFPTKYGSEFGEDFDAKMKSISRWLFAVTSHMYYAHYLNLFHHENLHLYLNQILAHLILLTDEFDLLNPTDLLPFTDLLRFILPKQVFKKFNH